MHCQQCGYAATEGGKQCSNCGARLPVRCRACEALNAPEANFCIGCGANIGTPYTRAASDSQAERRQLTVMFCDLVESTAMSTRLDPEELREVIRKFQGTCTAVVKDRKGFVAKYMGDGLLAYFGYPQAHEDDAERAINAGLEIVDAVEALKLRPGHLLEVRTGIATGVVVVGDLAGTGPAAEAMVVGTTPSLAARLQGVAEPGTVVISDLTRKLAGGLFHYGDLGPRSLKGFSTPVPTWQVTGRRTASSRFAAQHEGLPQLFGREEELATILELWRRARQGQGQVILLSGENGVGKSHLAQVVRERLEQEEGVEPRYYRAPMYQSGALLPVIRQIERAAGIGREDPPELRLEKLSKILKASGSDTRALLPILADLLSIPRASGDERTSRPPNTMELTLDALVTRDIDLASRSPALILFEDAHWADPATLGFLGRLVDRIRGKRVLLLITHRPDFTPPWSAAAHIASIRLDGLGRDDCGAMVERLAGGKRLPETVIDEIVATTGGIPLYVEEVTKTLLASGMLEEGPDGYMLAGPLEPLTIPASLNDSLMARLDKLGHAKDVAQVAAILGRTFTRTQLTAISPVTEEELEGAIAQLVEADVIRPVSTHGGQAYDFRTPLLRDVAYQSLLLSKRRELHLRAAQLLERVYTGTSETEPELLAHHYASAGLNERAIAYWRRAAERASERYASTVAIGHLKRALDLLPALPETRSRDKHELVIRSALGTALLAVRGYAEEGVLINFTRARELAERIGSDHERFRAIRGLCLHSLMRGEHTTANRLADECLQLAEQVQDQPCVMEGHRLAGTCAFYTGRFGVSRVHMEKVVAIYDPRRDGHLAGAFGQDPGVMARIYLAWTLWITGHTEQALTTMNEAVALARQLGHPQSLILALYFATHLHLFRAEPADAQRHAASCLELARRDGLPFRTAMATIAEGCALAADGSFAKAAERLREGIALWRENGAELAVTLFAGTLANVCLNAGRLDGAWEALGEARQLEEANGEHFWAAELRRLEGRLLLATSPGKTVEAGEQLRAAVRLAEEQGARTLADRASEELKRLAGAEVSTPA